MTGMSESFGKAIRAWAGVGLAVWLSAGPAFAGGSRLARFEGALPKPARTERTAPSYSNSCVSPLFDALFAELLVEGLFYGVAYGGLNSVTLVSPWRMAEETDLLRREPGGALIPFAAAEISHQWLGGGTLAWDWRGEVGLALMGVTVRRTFYRESKADFDLDTSQIHGVYRMTFGERFEMGLAFGALEMKGRERRDGFSFGLPMRWHGRHGWGVEYRPAWSTLEETRISDHDLAVVLGWRYAYLRAGYRWFYHSDASLDGVHVGLGLKW